MEISALHLSNFRSYEQADVEFAQGVNLLVGGNGEGKTNLLEAVYLVGAFGSHRVSSNVALVRWDADRSVVKAVGNLSGRRVETDVEVKPGAGLRVRVNRVALQPGRAATATIASVMFSPEDLALVKGGPEEKRRFLDRAAAGLHPGAAADRQEFERVLRQRSAALRPQFGGSAPALAVWDEKLAKSAAPVIEARLEVVESVTPLVARHYRELAGGEDKELAVAYRASWCEGDPPRALGEIEEALRRALESGLKRDLERGVTHTGPHRDDLGIGLAGKDARSYASQGEQRTAALALRLAERELIAASRGEPPVLLLDDVFSELDDRRRERLTALLADGGQAILSATYMPNLPVLPARVFRVESGKVLVDE